MAALTDATLLCALNAVDLCDKCELNSFVHHGVRVGLGRLFAGLFAALVCVYAGRPKPGNRGPRDTALPSTSTTLLDRLMSQQLGAQAKITPLMPSNLAEKVSPYRLSIDS